MSKNSEKFENDIQKLVFNLGTFSIIFRIFLSILNYFFCNILLKIQLNIFLIKSRKIKKNVQTTNYSIQKNFLKICVKFYVNCVKFYVNCVKFYVNFPIFAKINSISFELKFSSMKQLKCQSSTFHSISLSARKSSITHPNKK